MLALSHRWFAWSTLLPFFLYPFQFLVHATRPCLCFSPRLAQICWWFTSLCTRLLILPKFSPSHLLWITKTRPSLSFLPLSSRIGCGDLTISWFFHVYVPTFQYSPLSYTLLLGHRTHIITRSFACIILYIASASRLRFPFFGSCPLCLFFGILPLIIFYIH